MGLNVNWETKIVEITSPTTAVDAQVLHDFIEDNMATSIGMGYSAILNPEGKVEDPSNPGVYSQIILIINSPWQIQFWGGSGYTRIYGGKIVGGLADQPVKATGTAGDLTVLESPVDGLTVTTGGGVSQQDIDDMADAVWDEDLTAHDTMKTAGSVQQSLEYHGVVAIDTVGGVSGTAWNIGTHDNPVNNLADALTIANARDIDRLDITGSLTITTGQDISGYTLIADRSLGNTVTVNSGAITAGTYFENLTVSGTMNGSVRYTTSVLGAINNFDGGAKNCLITENITITGTGANYLTDCDIYVSDHTAHKEISVGDTSLNIIRCRGNFKITDKTSANTLAIDLVAGVVEIDSTCVAGFIGINGIAEVTDNSGVGCTVFVLSMSHTAISENVWDEIITGDTHNLPTSAGRKLRQLNTSVIHEGTAQGSGTNNNQIQLDALASSVDGAYDPSLISIVDNTGTGQSRLILQYEGSTKTATVDRSWKVTPDNTSVFIISANAGREHVNEGLAQGGTSTSITLNAIASSVDDTYINQVVFVRSGAGEDQVKLITSYIGSSKVATIGGSWSVIPDTTSGYVVLATHLHEPEDIATAVWADNDFTTDILKLVGNKVTKSGDIITIYESDESTPWRQYDLTSGGRVEV